MIYTRRLIRPEKKKKKKEKRKQEATNKEGGGWMVPENFHSMALRSLVIFFSLGLKMAHLRES